jgi:hypothetical protein
MLQHDVTVREQELSVSKVLRNIEPELKSALYAAYELAGATKAALYLAPSNTSRVYEIATSYAFNPANRKIVDDKDPLVQRLSLSHSPIVVNSMGEDELVAEVLFRHDHQRLIAVPIFGRGRRMIGFLDLREKMGRKNFVPADVVAADRIKEEIVRILGTNSLFGLGRMPLVEMTVKDPAKSAEVWDAPRLPIRKTQAEPAGQAGLSTQAIEVIRLAHDRMIHRDLSIDRRRRILTDEESDRVRVLVPAALAIPGVVAAALTSTGSDERQTIFSHGEPTPGVVKLIREQVAKWAGKAVREASAVSIVNVSSGSLTTEQLRSVASCPLAPRAVEHLVLTIALDKQPDDGSRLEIERFAEFLGDAVEAIIGRMELQRERLAMAERLLEPDFNRYEGLADHSRLVSDVSHRFATFVGLSPHDAETVRIAALVHDVGLRLLDYQELTSAKHLSDDQRRAVTEHPLVGAALVEPILGPEVALAVLRHHERVDGTGYPGRVRGDRIPITAKIITIADAWVAMTSPWAYVKCVAPGDAVKRLREGAGTQFDAALVEAFLGARNEIVGPED